MAVEVELEVLKSVVNKLDSSLEKISEVSHSIARLLAVHDERLDVLEKTGDKRESEIRDLHSRITTQTREILDKLESVEKKLEQKMKESSDASAAAHNAIKIKIDEDLKTLDKRVKILENWKWYVFGITAVVLLLITNLPVLPKLFA